MFEGRPMWESYLPVVDAVLRGIESASDEMCTAGKVLLADDHGHTLDEWETRLTWKVMVAALRKDLAAAATRR